MIFPYLHNTATILFQAGNHSRIDSEIDQNRNLTSLADNCRYHDDNEREIRFACTLLGVVIGIKLFLLRSSRRTVSEGGCY